ncbi:Hypothetical Protein FCC1311_057392 [Hondaea fermentalgiana]|uniref:Uncharacterized protein n=1 Tax=Hondaea fermentalgiana TaxID=2315210 RepID=A0A2R5GIG1_9STRA|nr:Hypothetical Protein FCC1311_057392 [Hondaea fermentalgiana]|eukprot:GBG29518.1 Hypothetical Protein FCC1311_057392 [Hondaea fermentalgiana]
MMPLERGLSTTELLLERRRSLRQPRAADSDATDPTADAMDAAPRRLSSSRGASKSMSNAGGMRMSLRHGLSSVFRPLRKSLQKSSNDIPGDGIAAKRKFRLRLLRTIRAARFNEEEEPIATIDKSRGLDRKTLRLLRAGKLDEALELLESKAARTSFHHGEVSTQYANVINTYAQVWSDKASALAIGGFEFHKCLEEAIDCAERAREIFEQVLIIRAETADEEGMAWTHECLAHLLEDGPQPDYVDALDHAEQAFLLKLRLKGPKHEETKLAAADVTRLRKRNGGLTIVQV